MRLSLCFSAFCLLILFTSESFACICVQKNNRGKSEQKIIDENREEAKAVFSGEVTKIILSDAPEGKESATVDVYFKVFKSWKGITDEEVVVRTAHICCICGITFKVGERYLVYAHGDKYLDTNTCTRTKRLKYASKDIRFLGEAGKSFVEEKRKTQKHAKE